MRILVLGAGRNSTHGTTPRRAYVEACEPAGPSTAPSPFQRYASPGTQVDSGDPEDYDGAAEVGVGGATGTCAGGCPFQGSSARQCGPSRTAMTTSATNEPELRAKSDRTSRKAQWAPAYWNRYHQAEIAREPRWSGANTGGYVTPAVEDLYQRWLTALEPNARTSIEVAFHKLLVDELAYPVVYDFDLFAFCSGIVGPTAPGVEGGNTTWNIHTWTVD